MHLRYKYPRHFGEDVLFSFLATYSRATEIVALSLLKRPEQLHEILISLIRACHPLWPVYKKVIKSVHHDEGLQEVLQDKSISYRAKGQYLHKMRQIAEDEWLDGEIK